MDFTPGPADVEWRDRVRAFMDAEVRPRVGDYEAQKRELAGRFEIGVAFVSRSNPHSLKA